MTLNGSPIPSSGTATDFCNTQTGIATLSLSGPVGPSDVLTQSTNDNRAFQDPNLPTANPLGGLVQLTVPVGEPHAVSSFVSPLATFAPSGFPTCTADLEAQSISCSGLVPGETYTVRDGRTGASQSATGGTDGTIGVSFATGTLHGGDPVALSNGSRTLTTLHTAHLKVAINASRRCSPAVHASLTATTGRSATDAPINAGAGDPTVLAGGAALTGEVCPSSGDATGLSTSAITQTDELSDGQTQAEVPDIEDTSPLQGETVYGSFTALAESGLPGPHNSIIPTDGTSQIALSIAPAGGGSPVFTAGNVDTASGISVRALKPGTYKATWTLSDANGDTRTVTTRFIEQSGTRGPRGPRGAPGPKPKVSCQLRHNKINCKVTYPKSRKIKGKLQVMISRGKHVAALGHARVSRGVAHVTLREVRRIPRGSWTMTLVLTQPRKAPSTATARVRLR